MDTKQHAVATAAAAKAGAESVRSERATRFQKQGRRLKRASPQYFLPAECETIRTVAVGVNSGRRADRKALCAVHKAELKTWRSGTRSNRSVETELQLFELVSRKV